MGRHDVRKSLIRSASCGIRTQDLHLLAVLAQAGDGLGHGALAGAALAIDEEAVVPEAGARRGRDSIFVRFTPRKANSDRQRTSQPGLSSPGPQNASEVFVRAAASGWAPARASQTKR